MAHVLAEKAGAEIVHAHSHSRFAMVAAAEVEQGHLQLGGFVLWPQVGLCCWQGATRWQVVRRKDREARDVETWRL